MKGRGTEGREGLGRWIFKGEVEKARKRKELVGGREGSHRWWEGGDLQEGGEGRKGRREDL